MLSTNDQGPARRGGREGFDPGARRHATARGAPPATGQQEPGRFVLYFDFGQLRLGGRRQAIETAKRWVRETKADHDEAMIAAYVTSHGVRVLRGMTADRQSLLDALDAAYRDLALVDHFAVELPTRP
jgi:hypothetical protein